MALFPNDYVRVMGLNGEVSYVPKPVKDNTASAESANPRGILYTFSGKVAFPGGAPSLLDIAISLSREGRYAGAGLRWWPVALHAFVASDLVPKEWKFDALNHDDSETITGDTTKPAKTDAIERFEDALQVSIYESWGIIPPSDEEYAAVIKPADTNTLAGEVYTVGNQWLQPFYQRCPEAEERIRHYVDKYTYADMLESSGRVPMEFMARWREYRDYLPKWRFKK